MAHPLKRPASMARPLRIQLPGLTYHVTSRGNNKMTTFLDDYDHEHFLELLGETADIFHLECHAYALMVNHYHLVIRTLEANLARAMHRLNGRYAQFWNRRHKRVGHLTQGRYGAQVLQDEIYYLNACRYVVQNPLRARMVKTPADWPWSSCRATMGLVAAPEWLFVDELLRRFGDDGATAVAGYRRFVGDPVQGDHPMGRDVPILGDEVFRRRFRKQADEASGEVTRRDRLAAKPSLPEVFTSITTRTERDVRIIEAFKLGYTMAEISRHLHLHYATISRILARGQILKNVVRQDLTPGVKP
jgi:REP element-mobilizing transposase RayT